jgi:hypothetical protein
MRLKCCEVLLSIVAFQVQWNSIFFLNANFYINYLFEMPKFEEITKEIKIQKKWKPMSFHLM